jgi:hypothetical protein
LRKVPSRLIRSSIVDLGETARKVHANMPGRPVFNR